MRVKVGDRSTEERSALGGTDAGQELQVAASTGGIDRDVDVLPADLGATLYPGGERMATAATARQTTRTFGVDLDHLTRLARDEHAAPRAVFGEQLAQPVHVEATQDPIGGAPRDPGERSD